MSFSRFGWTAVVLFALACRERATVRPPPDGGLVCGENERIVQGECTFVCDRDADCEQSQRCNLLTGRCEARPPEPDAGPMTIRCTTGAERCSLDKKAVESCDIEGRWQVKEPCPLPSGFCLNEKCLFCQPGSSRCADGNPKQVLVCADDGSATRTVTCDGAATCTEGECRECTPGERRCSPDGKSVQTCQKTQDETSRWAWVNTGDAFDGTCITQSCEVASGQARCRPPQCFPGATQCKDAQTQQVCSATGSWSDVTCSSLSGYGPGAVCQNGVCFDECVEAAKAKSYFGCEYWTAVQDNSVDTVFKGNTQSGQGTADSDFAFVVANRSVNAATVEVWRHNGSAPVRVKTEQVMGRNDPATKGLRVIKVPWQSIGPASNVTGVASTGLARYGYRLTSTRPITVYQFSPLEAVKISSTACTASEGSLDTACKGNLPQCCADAFCQLFFGYPLCPGVCKTTGGNKRCHYYSYSNDASLLLPAHILGTSHVVVTTEHIAIANNANSSPVGSGNGHLTIVATQDATQVTIRSSARTLAGGGITAMQKGEQRTFTMNSYDVLQLATDHLGNQYIECAPNPFGGSGVFCRVDNDLTGTVVTSTKPIAVFGGAACALRPFDRAACDHLEEQIFPFETWGKHFVAIRSHPFRLRDQSFATNSPPDHFKVVASCPASQCPQGTLITFSTPPAASNVLPPNRCATGTIAGNDCRLMGGQYMEFKHTANFTITALEGPIAVAQFFPGQGPAGVRPTDPEQGDPSMVLLPPSEQWRTSYTVLAAPGIKDNYLAIAIDGARVASVEVDGVAVTGFTAVPGTTFMVKNHPITVGTHTINVVPRAGQNPLPGAGITVYGYDEYVSYGYTGGLDLTPIVSGIDPGG